MKVLYPKVVKPHSLRTTANKVNEALIQPGLIIPAIAIGSLFYEADAHENDIDKAKYLGDTMSGLTLSVLLQKIPGVFPIAAATSVIIRAFEGKDKNEKASSIVKDSIWLACGYATQQIFSKRFFNKTGEKPLAILKYLAELCSFTVGAIVISPVLSNFVNKHITDRLYPKPKKDEMKEIEEEEVPALPISMDRYNLGRVLMAEEHKPSKKGNNDNKE